jgi:DNA recombination protein Rad52
MSAFDADQIAALRAPLARDHVKGRQQAGRNVSYIEGWHAIAEANRIFGFDAWDRELVDFKCVSEKPCEIGRDKKPGFRVAYIGRVRVTVRAGDKVIVREGAGYGSGIDADVGEAHESAIKEMETDSMKRALMTFGNPFGLALYDKAQAEVEPAQGQRRAAPPTGERNVSPPPQPQENGNAAPAMRATALPPHPEEPPEVREARDLARVDFQRLQREISEALTEEAINHEKRGIWARNKDALASIHKHGGVDAVARLHDVATRRLDELRAMMPAREAAE